MTSRRRSANATTTALRGGPSGSSLVTTGGAAKASQAIATSTTRLLEGLRRGRTPADRAGNARFREQLRASILARKVDAGDKRRTWGAKFGLTLDYDPENLDLYCLAYSGAMAGMIAGRSIAGNVLADYTEVTVAAGVWAQEFDTLWASAAAIDEVQALLALDGSYAVWEGRAGVALTATECATTILAIIASVEEAEVYLAAQGITPPPWREGGGGASSQSTYRAGGVVDLTGSPLSLIGGAVTIDIATSAPNFSVIATVNITDSTDSGDSATASIYQNGVASVTQVLNYGADGGAFTLLYGGDEPAGGDTTFDLLASGGSGVATALGAIIVMATP